MVRGAVRARIVGTTTIFSGLVDAERRQAYGRRMRDVLLDRDAELAALADRLAQTRAGAGRVIVVDGVAGIGKSSLLAAAIGSAEAQGVTVLRARAGPLEQDAAWGVARQLFAPLQRGPQWSELTVGAAGLARRVLDSEAPEPAFAGDAMHAAAHGLEWLAINLAERAPAVLVIDDVHWADAPSLRWLAQLAVRLEELRLGLLCAVRSGEPAGHPNLLAELLAAAPENPVRPRALGPAAAEALVAERLPSADPSFAHACHAVTAGNPFLLGALLRHLALERVTPTDQVAAGLSAFGPEQVARSVHRRLDRLPEGAAALARALAVLGRRAPLRHAAQLARLTPEDAARLADALRVAGLLEGERELALTHPLVAGALRASFGAGELAQWHVRAAAILAAEAADPERIALHLLHTDAAAAPETVAVLRAAAERALARGAPESAATFLRRALTEPPLEPALAADVRLELGLALAARLLPEAPGLLHEAVELAASPGQRVDIALRGARAVGLAGHFPDALDLCRRGLAHATDVDPEAVARLEAELVCNASMYADGVPEVRARLLRPTVPAATLELWRPNAAMQALFCGQPAADVLELLRPALTGDALTREPDSLLNSVAMLVLIQCDELEAACASCTALIDFARPRGWRIALAHGSFLRAIALGRAGRIREAEADARLSFEFKRGYSPLPALLWSLYPLVDALTELDEPAAADTTLASVGLGDPPAGVLASPLLLQSRARLRLVQRRPADAHADLCGAAARWEEFGILHPGFASWRVDATEALVALGEIGDARRHADEHIALSERLGLPGPLGAGLRARAGTADGGDRIALLERAVTLLADSQTQLEHARALTDLGAALRRANRRADARAPLRQALDLAERGGMRILARRARDELRATGARPRRAALTGPHALTAAEHRVAHFAADGNSNREIAAQLYVTQRTVETHLTHAFQKLDIHARAELPAALAAGDSSARAPALA
jgi:DNA-binding CsgD family transcriptional regulator